LLFIPLKKQPFLLSLYPLFHFKNRKTDYMAPFTHYFQQLNDFITKKLGSESSTAQIPDTNVSLITVTDYSDPDILKYITGGIALLPNEVPNEPASYENVPVELIMVGDSEFPEVADMLAHCVSMVVNEKKTCQPGTIFENCVQPFIEDSDLRHILLIFQNEWADPLMAEQPFEPAVTFLQGIAINQSEKEFCEKNGCDALLDLIDEEADILDLYREPVI
jgi:hypothetical protein